ncbi:MAG: NADH-quinone oxidoreductase subunit J [Acidobacteria bacterium]|nr:NADH-quinone oxidoreductase subunit J [Acidobacteriota bacterium]
MLTVLLFILFGGLAIGCGVSMVAQRNPLYGAISLIGVFVSLACLYVMLAAPFIAAVQVIVYAGAIMVLVVFVIMLLNVEEEARHPARLRYLIPIGVLLAAALIGEAAFMLTLRGGSARIDPTEIPNSGVGLTMSIGTGLFTKYLLPFEVTSVLILMALVGAITLARRADVAKPQSRDDFGTDPAYLPATNTPRGESIIQPGLTAATGRAMAEYQIEHGEAAAREEQGEV